MIQQATGIIYWITSKPVTSLAAAIAALLGYSHIFILGFSINVPSALRPFLDGYFYSTLALNFFVSVAAAGISAKILILLARLLLSNFPTRFYYIGAVTAFGSLANKIFNIERVGRTLDRQTQVRLKLLARWMRRKKPILSIVSAIILFSILFLGLQSFWYIPLCILLLPAVWSAVSIVELRRKFATPRNTTSITPNRVASAAIGFALIYLAICAFLAGIASFHTRMASQVSVGVGVRVKHSYLIAATSSGVIVGEWTDELPSIPFLFPVSAHFLPYESFSSLGQKN